MKLFVVFCKESLENFYFAHNKVLNKYGYLDAYFYFQNQRIYVTGLPPNFFSQVENWIGIQKKLIILNYVTKVKSFERNTYTYYGSYFTNTAVWFLPFNFYSNGFIYWDSASQIRSGNEYYNILACNKFILAPVKERNDVVTTGGDTLLVYDNNGNLVPPKKAPNNQPYPFQSFSIRNPETFSGFLVTFVNDIGKIEYKVFDPNNCNLKIEGSKDYTPLSQRNFKIGLSQFREQLSDFNYVKRQINAVNLDYIQSYQDAFCGCSITALPLNQLLSPTVPNENFKRSQFHYPTIGSSMSQYTPYGFTSRSYYFTAEINNNLIIKINHESYENYEITSDIIPYNDYYYGDNNLKISFNRKVYNNTPYEPIINKYQYGEQTTLLNNAQQGKYVNNILVFSLNYVGIIYQTTSTSDLIFFRDKNSDLIFDIIYNNQQTNGLSAFNTLGIPRQAIIYINIYKKNQDILNVDTYNQRTKDNILNAFYYMPPVETTIDDEGLLQLASFDFNSNYNELLYRTSYFKKDIEVIIILKNYEIVENIYELASTLRRCINSGNSYMFLAQAKSNDGGLILKMITDNPGDYPLIVDNLPDYNNQDIINVKNYPSINDRDTYARDYVQSNYPVYTSGVDEEVNWVISKYTKGISEDETNDCTTLILNTEKNEKYYQDLKNLSATNDLPYEILVESKTIRQGIRMFNDIFRHRNNLQREIRSYVTILCQTTNWIFNPDTKLYESNTFVYPQLWFKFKYGAFIGFEGQYKKSYTRLFCNLDRIVYYVPKPSTIKTKTDIYMSCRELEHRREFKFECDQKLEYVLFIVALQPAQTIHY